MTAEFETALAELFLEAKTWEPLDIQVEVSSSLPLFVIIKIWRILGVK